MPWKAISDVDDIRCTNIEALRFALALFLDNFCHLSSQIEFQFDSGEANLPVSECLVDDQIIPVSMHCLGKEERSEKQSSSWFLAFVTVIETLQDLWEPATVADCG